MNYWRVILWHNTNYVAPGDEGEYDWGATYTLKIRRSDNDQVGDSRAAVNPSGIYYIYAHSETVFKIMGEGGIKSVVQNELNPYVEKWVHPKVKTVDFDVTWKVFLSKSNDGDNPLTFKYTKIKGFREKTTVGSRLTVTESTTTGVSVNSSFEAKGISGGFELKNEKTNTVEKQTVNMSEVEVYEETKEELSYTLEANTSIQLWQPIISLFGNELVLDFTVYTNVGDEAPVNPKFDKYTLSFYNWNES